jgi:Icc-related predicted phosphoesterase
LKILAVSDVENGLVYSPSSRERFKDARLVISCGDLPLGYLEYIINTLEVPLYFVFGNHTHLAEKGEGERNQVPWGAFNLQRRTVRDETGVLLAGLEGSVIYNYGPYQYSQEDMWLKAFSLVPGLIINKLRFGRYLDIFVSHAPPWKIHDQDDLPHQGIKAFRWLLKTFQPALHLHGHIHVYDTRTVRDTVFQQTRVLNVYGYKEIDVNLEKSGRNKHP